jgi:hypothetical protein
LIQLTGFSCTGAFEDGGGNVCFQSIRDAASAAANVDFPDVGADGFAAGFATATGYTPVLGCLITRIILIYSLFQLVRVLPLSQLKSGALRW